MSLNVDLIPSRVINNCGYVTFFNSFLETVISWICNIPDFSVGAEQQSWSPNTLWFATQCTRNINQKQTSVSNKAKSFSEGKEVGGKKNIATDVYCMKRLFQLL